MSQRKLYESDYYLRAFLCLEVVMFIFTPTEGIGLLTDQNNAVVEDLQSSHEEVILLKEQNRHLPRTCRTDICLMSQTTSERKGDISWPETYVDTLVRITCPYSTLPDQYATRACVMKNASYVNLDSDDDDYDYYPYGMYDYTEPIISEVSSKMRVVWTDASVEDCPDPPFTELMNEFRKSLMKPYDLAGEWYKSSLHNANQALTMNRTNPVFVEDAMTWVSFLCSLVEVFTTRVDPDSADSLSLEDLQAILNVSSHLITKGVIKYQTSQTEKDRFIGCLSYMGYLLHPTEVHREDNIVQSDHIVVQISNVYVSWDNTVGVHFDNTFDGRLNTPLVTVSAMLKSSDNIFSGRPIGKNVFFYTMALRSSVFFAQKAELWVDTSDIQLNDQVPSKVYKAPMLSSPEYTAAEPPVPTRHAPHTSSWHDPPPPPERRKRAGVPRGKSLSNTGDIKIQDPSVEVAGMVVYVGVVNSQKSVDMDVHLDVLFYDQNRAICAVTPGASLEHVISVNLSDAYQEWHDDMCESVFLKDGTYCRCRGLGYFTTFTTSFDFVHSDIGHNYDHYWGIGTQAEDPIAVFLGFPHQRELYIIGHVLRALSFVGLVLTLLSHSIFRNKRRGSTTLILQNLCVSLLGLLLALYVAERLAHTYNGCRVANLLRYYFVMVSLLWNGVEAVNMYMKLVKVFNSHVSHLVLKAAIVAWGLPLGMIGVSIIADNEIFDGYFTDCIFRCGMKTPLLYYGYLLPMGLIIIYNLIVFSLVLRVIIIGRHTRKPSGEKQSRREHFVRLAAAVTMLVLLGVPWIFSSFGVIESSHISLKLLEGIFQVIFVVFVNLQGVFIFLFHCARNKDVRQDWSRLARSGFSTISTTRSSLELQGNDSKTSRRSAAI